MKDIYAASTKLLFDQTPRKTNPYAIPYLNPNFSLDIKNRNFLKPVVLDSYAGGGTDVLKSLKNNVKPISGLNVSKIAAIHDFSKGYTYTGQNQKEGEQLIHQADEKMLDNLKKDMIHEIRPNHSFLQGFEHFIQHPINTTTNLVDDAYTYGAIWLKKKSQELGMPVYGIDKNFKPTNSQKKQIELLSKKYQSQLDAKYKND